MRYAVQIACLALGIILIGGCGLNNRPLIVEIEPDSIPAGLTEIVPPTSLPEQEKDDTLLQFEKANFCILYVGHPGSDRESDFVMFLKPHFKEIKTTDLGSFKEEQAADCDVAIFDYDGDGFKAPQQRLSERYTRATITVGVAGAFICSNRGLKTGYL